MKSKRHPAILILLWSLFPLAVFSQEPEPVEAEFTQAELDQMLAPIALYPDVLLSQVLMAATYPLEIVEASRWSRNHPELEGDDAVQAVQDKPWDMSVKALVGFPDLIQRMDENLEWTRSLGDAFLMQEEQVMETTQNLRERALEEGSLAEVEHITVEREAEHIIIEPADVRVVYVPYYSTRVVYGDWWWADYPPFYWGPPVGTYSSFGFYWGHGFRVSTHFYYSTCDWPRRSIVIVNSHRGPNRFDFHRSQVLRRYDHYAHVWHHDPYHRKSVRYRHSGLYERFNHDRSHGERRVRVPYTDRDRHSGHTEKRTVVSDRRERIDRQHREAIQEQRSRYNREQYERGKRTAGDSSDRKRRIVTDRRETSRESPSIRRDQPQPRQNTVPDRRESRTLRQQPTVVTRPNPPQTTIPAPTVEPRVENRRSSTNYQFNTKSSRMQRSASKRTSSLERRGSWRKMDP